MNSQRVLVMGLMTPNSLAWTIGQRLTRLGAEVVYTVVDERTERTLLKRSFKQAGIDTSSLRILPCDVTDPRSIDDLFRRVAIETDEEACLDGIVHSIAYANPATCLGGNLWDAPIADVAQAFMISAASLAYVAGAAVRFLRESGSIVSLTFDSQHAYPAYNWMGVCKAGLEATTRYLALQLGPKGVAVNCISAGPQATAAAERIPGFDHVDMKWQELAPLGWNTTTSRHCVAQAAEYLLQSNGVTGQVLYVDGGASAVKFMAPTEFQEGE